ncbi:MAG: DJ-1/PfpI family protein [Chloroflexi bacterium]|nr:DJ-1/PfpI family protein [Chloroflexota bacterium]
MKTKLFLICAIVLYVIAFGACATPAPTPVPPPDPASLIKVLVDTLNAGNVDAAMAFFADDATQTQTPPPAGTSGVRTGKEQIRDFYKGLIADHFSVELSNVRAVSDKITYTCTFSTDSYKKMGVAPLVTIEEAVFVGGRIKSQTITVTPESLAKIQAAMAAAQAKTAPPKKILLILASEKSEDMELVLTKEVGVMVSTLEKASYKVVVASASGQPLVGSATTLKPDLKLADVQVDDYAGVIVPCLAPISSEFKVPPDAAEIVKKAVAQGKPVAAQLTGVFTLAAAGVLNGKQFAINPGYENYIPKAGGIFKGAGVVQDGNIVTSGTCPKMASAARPDGTTELTQKFIALLASAR